MQNEHDLLSIDFAEEITVAEDGARIPTSGVRNVGDHTFIKRRNCTYTLVRDKEINCTYGFSFQSTEVSGDMTKR